MFTNGFRFHTRTNGNFASDCERFAIYPDNNALEQRIIDSLGSAYKVANETLKNRKFVGSVTIYGFRNGKKIYVNTVTRKTGSRT